MEWPKLVEAWERDIAPASRAVPSRLGAIVVFVVLCLLVFVCVVRELSLCVGCQQWNGQPREPVQWLNKTATAY